MFYGFVITEGGNQLLAKLVAGQTLRLSSVIMDLGTVEDKETARKLTAPLEPGPTGISTAPIVKGNQVDMIVQFRSDLGGGLKEDMWIGGFGIYAKDPDTENDVMIYYASLGHQKQPIAAYINGTAPDTRNFPVSILITAGVNATLTYPAGAWVVAEDVAQVIAAHNTDPDAHGGVGSKVIVVDLTIPTEGWSDSGTGKYSYHLDIPVDGTTAQMVPTLTVLEAGETAAITCGLCPRVQTLDGVLRVFAAVPPSVDIPASLTLQGSGGSPPGGGTYDLPPATATTLGAVKAGRGLIAAKDGTLSVNISTATEINQLLEEVFGA